MDDCDHSDHSLAARRGHFVYVGRPYLHSVGRRAHHHRPQCRPGSRGIVSAQRAVKTHGLCAARASTHRNVVRPTLEYQDETDQISSDDVDRGGSFGAGIRWLHVYQANPGRQGRINGIEHA